MKNQLKLAFAIVLIITFGIFLPSFFVYEAEDVFVQASGAGVHTEAEYTQDTDKKLLHDNYMGLESQREIFSAQKFEQRRAVYRFSIEILAFLVFSLGICLKRVYLSYIQFYLVPFAHFLYEYSILLEKDGKKRGLAF